jgi:hypothetical protein
MNGPYHLYDTSTGLFAGQSFHTNDADPVSAAAFARSNTPAGHAVYEGAVADHQSQRVDIESGKLVEYQPPAPGGDHEWHEDTKRWRRTNEAQARIDGRAAALARISALVDSQHQFVREHLLGVTTSLERLSAIHAEISKLNGEL